MKLTILIFAVTLALAVYLAAQEVAWVPSLCEIGAAGEWRQGNGN